MIGIIAAYNASSVEAMSMVRVVIANICELIAVDIPKGQNSLWSYSKA